ncbi:hypothetical protein DM01DRAFT_1335018 [Hesseltinella vesiculosa]|uniref:Uncharacterized protein n=1 Tax=Hesseltinella vesiculosa TaxID=101127 RepID=A0A1X2GK28_9FUNG|nr:hypothetical protein DM01DRAFT_1335018 [Hesseltinella vesiculosa]
MDGIDTLPLSIAWFKGHMHFLCERQRLISHTLSMVFQEHAQPWLFAAEHSWRSAFERPVLQHVMSRSSPSANTPPRSPPITLPSTFGSTTLPSATP